MDGGTDNTPAKQPEGDRLSVVSLADKFDLSVDEVFVNGVQAVLRMCLMQSELDKAKGLNTAGYVSGYRGSPLGGIDLQFAQAQSVLKDHHINFSPALNEDLAATAVWGTQQAALHGENATDGVFAIWYGKGPGVDRTGDVFRHANLAGTDKNGGVLALMGDDHTGESSTVCHQSEYAMMDVMIPVLNPVNLAEMVQFGLHGWALSRYSGLWVGLKCVKDNIESSASVRLSVDDFHQIMPNDTEMPEDGLNIRRNDHRHQQEQRLHEHKLAAAHAYVRANHLDRVIWDGGKTPQFGIVSTGKAYMDVLQALSDLGITEQIASQLGLAVYKIGMSWPVEPRGISAFAASVQHLMVVEEKRGLIEDQIKSILYAVPDAPSVIGKKDADGNRLFTEEGSVDAVQIAIAIIEHLLIRNMPDAAALPDEVIGKAALMRGAVCRDTQQLGLARTPYFCAGCPHNSSTILPEGARGYAGIGCHWMVQFMDRDTEGNTHMGGEGANWIGEASFSTRGHVFQNMGDGTFNHSGLMAIRAAIAADVNITYKILYNDAVAMTGGQTHEGDMTPVEIAELLVASGVKKLVLVTDDLSRHRQSDYPAGTDFYHRLELQHVQKQLAEIAGVTALLYDQTCATEKRRRRKRGLMEDPNKRVVINPEVCEGCGDCGVQSNCVAILPLETPLGRKRQIDQSACNKDFSCVNGFCPSFVTVTGGRLAKPQAKGLGEVELPPAQPVFSADKNVSILLTGVGGTGVVTIGALLGMAAHLDNKGCGIIDMAGLAQKGGAVTSHIRIGAEPEDITAIRIGPGGADVLLGCDSLVAADSAQLKLMHPDGQVVANLNQMPTGDFTRQPDQQFPHEQVMQRLQHCVGSEHCLFVDATALALELTGDAISANLIMLGAAYQKGLIPVRAEAIEQAIELNNVAVSQSLDAFRWGRLSVADPQALSRRLGRQLDGALDNQPDAEQLHDNGAEAVIADRTRRLTDYHNARYAASYQQLMEKIVSRDITAGQQFSVSVAQNLYKMMAIKDEYEVARLYTDGRFAQMISEKFDGDVELSLHLAPPLFSKTDKHTGRPMKKTYGRWMFGMMRILARLKMLRETPFDLFGYIEERRTERQWRQRYQQLVLNLAEQLSAHNSDTAIALAEIPQQIRGFGVVRAAAFAAADKQMTALLEQFERQSAGH